MYDVTEVQSLLPPDWASIPGRDHEIFTCPKNTDQLWHLFSFLCRGS